MTTVISRHGVMSPLSCFVLNVTHQNYFVIFAVQHRTSIYLFPFLVNTK